MKPINTQRWLAVGLLLLVVSILLFAVLLPLLDSGLSYYDEKVNLLSRLQRQQQIIARQDQVTQNLQAMQSQLLTQDYFINRETEALASADLQNMVKVAVTEGGGQLTSTQGLPGRPDKGFIQVAVRVRMAGNMDNLRTALYRLTSSTPILLIDQLDAVPARAQRTPINPGLNNNRNPQVPSDQLNFSFQVIGFMRESPK